MKKLIYKIMQKLFKNRAYSFRKYVYLKVLKLDVCHFCLQEYTRGGKTYCLDCLKETD